MNGIIFRISLRNLLKNKFTSLVSLLGLMVGFVAVILVTLFISYELSWDKENENYERIYILQRNIALSTRNSGTGSIKPFTPELTAPLMEVYPSFFYLYVNQLYLESVYKVSVWIIMFGCKACEVKKSGVYIR